MHKLFFIAMMGVVLISYSNNSLAIEEPQFSTIEKSDNWEVRHYQSFNIAKVYVKADESRAGNYGFRPLANYIFGGNSKSKKMAMTAPVMQKKVKNNVHQISFFMSRKFKLQELPTPKNSDVMVEQHPETHFLVTRFSGGWNQKKWAKRADELNKIAEEKGWKVISRPVYARYNSPWTPTFLRRNEILIPVKLK